MSVDCIIELEYGSEGQAEAVIKAIGPDNAPYASAVLAGKKVTVSTSAETSLSLLHTVEDLLACVRVAEEASDAASGPPPSL